MFAGAYTYELASPYEKYLNLKATNQLSYFDGCVARILDNENVCC
jgi:hypothetical protein